MRAALLIVAAVAVLGVMLSRTRGPVVVSGSPAAPAVTPVAPRTGAPEPVAGSGSPAAAPATNLATPTFGKPLVITPVATTKRPASRAPIAGAKGE
ncbi:MAG: hypothetical protein HY553_20690 [Elusimicrobia bacterium]|nr:hypothetical protein [Elusimicrobiota bacterium]